MRCLDTRTLARKPHRGPPNVASDCFCAQSQSKSAISDAFVVLGVQAVARRGVLAGVAGSIALLSGVRPSEAAFGEAARVSKIFLKCLCMRMRLFV